ncbi:AKAP7 2'5' RNA ligase-like domain-containing protein [Aspergillus cavernicola]|uniref:AKAP7 2'5' RNA ligase-like domain-containing protein n=1 Tax=Aspergillus cavernicola TaxID=176166 RepID=A0ABR4J548_9EURO
MSEKKHNQNKTPNRPRPKRPPLTHFLCLPLINSISLPQFESSQATFKASITPAFPTKSAQNEHQQQRQRPLIPDDAIRPLGTLHLTLGAMSLPTPERLDEAIRFFHSLDLAVLMRNAEGNAAQKKRLNASSRNREIPAIELVDKGIEEEKDNTMGEALEPIGAPQNKSTTPDPFTISLESLHVLPRARSATVLYAAPVDPTSRLYPFCEILRNKFLEAGFLQGEYKQEPDKKKPDNQSQRQDQSTKDQELPSSNTDPTKHPTGTGTGEEPTLREETPTEFAEETAQQPRPPVTTISTERKNERKPRPLLLHATIVNTIYIRGRKRNAGGQGKKNQRNNQYTFDAREILTTYRNFYLDSYRTVPRSSGVILQNCLQGSSNDDLIVEGNHFEEEKVQNAGDDGKTAGYPFVWARNFPLEAICICEMGAKKLDPDADESGMNARLREKYAVVAERSLDFRTPDRNI